MLKIYPINDEKFNAMVDAIIKKRNIGSYNGITKKLVPKWLGWKYIDLLKKGEILIKDINKIDNEHFVTLDTMALNYYTILFLSDTEPNTSETLKTNEET